MADKPSAADYEEARGRAIMKLRALRDIDQETARRDAAEILFGLLADEELAEAFRVATER